MHDNRQKTLSKIPPVNQILDDAKIRRCMEKYSRGFVLSLIQEETQRYKEKLLIENVGDISRDFIQEELVSKILTRLQKITSPSLKKVINATGIILHTGLGRAPLNEEARENLMNISEGYCSLEVDLESGNRGNRNAHVESLICQLTGAEAACVVNNNAAAVLLTLNTLCFGREAIISRGELIEIGGSFRIPEVMEKSGAKMVEVGTTNKTHLKDYRRAISERSGLICVVHPSNYRVKGFTAETPLPDLVELANHHGLPIFQDLGGGVLVDLREYGLPYEPVVAESVENGVDVVTFSGDKVLGGPQSGIVVGKQRYLDKIKANPLMRALRCDKLIYAALEPSLKLYLQQELLTRHSVLKMLLEPIESLQSRMGAFVSKISAGVKEICQISIADTFVQIGSGALPLEQLPSKAISLRSDAIPTESLAQRFRLNEPPIIGYVRDDRLFFDFRTLSETDASIVLAAIESILLESKSYSTSG